MNALVLGAGGFIGSHMVKRLKYEGYWVRGVDLKQPEFSKTKADDFVVGDLRNPTVVQKVLTKYIKLSNQKEPFDLVIQLAADMGGAAFIFTGENDADVMHNSALINLNVSYWAAKYKAKKIFYSSSACIYPQEIQETTNNPGLKEWQAYPVNPDSDYGYEKIFSERVYDAFRRNYGLNIRVARFHNIFGEEGTFKGGREKAPSAMCRKVAEAKNGESIEVWGDGLQTRSFLYIDECVEGVMRLLESDYYKPINIGSDEMVSINQLAQMVIGISGKDLSIKNVPSNALGVRGRNSDNALIREKLNWAPSKPLIDGLRVTYQWVLNQIQKDENNR